MLELGNQHLFLSEPPRPDFPAEFVSMKGVPAKPYWERAGYRHISVDLGGQDGALVLNLCQPFDLGQQFNVVTDFGTSEHVADLYACLENMWRHCRVGGWMLLANPAPGSWPDHGYWYRTNNFYFSLVRAQPGLDALDVRQVPALGNTVNGWLTYAALRKREDAPWLSREQYAAVPVTWVEYKPDCNWRG